MTISLRPWPASNTRRFLPMPHAAMVFCRQQ